MSYILEALKKADRERGIGAVPSLATAPEVERAPNRSRRWLWIVAALLCANLVLVVMLLNHRDAGTPVTAEVPVEPRPSVADAPPPPATPKAPVIETSEPPLRKKTMPPEQPPALSAGGVVVLPSPTPSQDPVASLPPRDAFDTRTDDATTVQDTSQLRSWQELPRSIRDRLNLPRLDLHVYSEDPQNRFIMVNLKKYREGDRFDNGLVLEEILPDGMVMSYQGERFLVEK